MNTFKRKALFTAVVAGLGAAMVTAKAASITAAWYVLGPVHDYCMNPRNGIVKWDTDSETITKLEKSIKDKFEEVKSALKVAQDTMSTAVEKDVKKYGDTIEAKTADALKAAGENTAKVQGEFKALIEGLNAKMLELEQKSVRRTGSEVVVKTAGQMFAESEQYKFMMKLQGADPKRSDPVEIKRENIPGFQKTAIFNATLNNDQPLVQAFRTPGIITAPERRLTIRDLLPSIPTSSNVIEYVSELVFTNNAGPQGGGSSPDQTEGQIKPESGITFQLQNGVVITIAHWIPASRQIMQDAPQLAAYIDSRLGYGLKLEEEDELLNSSGTNGELNGLRNAADDFAYGVTNQTALDTLLKALLQVSLSNYEATGFILHPLDWTQLLLLKDTTGRYLFSNPQDVTTPRLWGKPVVATATQTAGRFVTGAFDLGAAIYDREGMSIRVSDQHSDYFVRNMVAILCEERLAFIMYRPSAFVEGAVSNAG